MPALPHCRQCGFDNRLVSGNRHVGGILSAAYTPNGLATAFYTEPTFQRRQCPMRWQPRFICG